MSVLWLVHGLRLIEYSNKQGQHIGCTATDCVKAGTPLSYIVSVTG